MKNNKKRDKGKRMTSKGSSAFFNGKQDKTKKGATSNAKPAVLLPQNDRQQFSELQPLPTLPPVRPWQGLQALFYSKNCK